MRNIHGRAAATALAAALLGGALGTLAPVTAWSDAELTQRDRDFLSKAAQGGELEVKAGKLASQRASAPAVRSFGERMVTDHSAANDQLRALAASKQMPLPSDLTPEQQKLLGKLESLNGTEFDQSYAAMMVRDHTKDVGEFKHEAHAAKDPDVKAFATQTLPTLQHHLTMARQLTKEHEHQ